jgi:hypothetical protein
MFEGFRVRSFEAGHVAGVLHRPVSPGSLVCWKQLQEVGVIEKL